MLTYDEIYSKPELPGYQIAWLWEDDYYDGPLKGMITYCGKSYYAILFDIHYEDIQMHILGHGDIDRIRHNTYAVYELTPERQDWEEAWREFNQLVRDAWPYKSSPANQYYSTKYKQLYTELDIDNAEEHGKIIGWFMD
jgi:hypothetical protein